MNNDRDLQDMTPIKEYVTWNDVEEYISSLKNLIESHNFNGVYGPARGGLIFAVMVSHRYDLPFLGAPQKGCLVIDDIVDTGDTAMAWRAKGYSITSMYFNDKSKVSVDYYLHNKEDKWIVFPYEKQD